MVEVRNAEREMRQLRTRLSLAGVLVLLAFGLLTSRLVWLQLIRYEQFSAQAESNRIAVVPVSPARGLIYDRHGVVLAENVSAYTLELSPRRIQALDQTIDDLAALIEIGPRERRRFKRLLEDSKNAEWLPLKTRLTDTEVALITAHRYRFAGVDIKARLFRNYPLGEGAAHLIGYIGRIAPEDKRRLACLVVCRQHPSGQGRGGSQLRGGIARRAGLRGGGSVSRRPRRARPDPHPRQPRPQSGPINR
jgi:penicillin-binding protein 2